MFNKIRVIDESENKSFNLKTDLEKLKAGADMLVDGGFASEILFDKIVESIDQYGPYFVFDNGISVAHAAPGKHCKKTGASLIVAKDGVDLYGKSINFMITLSVPESGDHMVFLQKVISFLRDEESKNRILNYSKEDER